jgi:hypothetical protein
VRRVWRNLSSSSGLRIFSIICAQQSSMKVSMGAKTQKQSAGASPPSSS